jgi:hypothetical protein
MNGVTEKFCFRSSRRKEAPYLVVPSSQEELEPPYVGCYEKHEICGQGLGSLRLCLDPGSWSFSGVWNLELGIS